MWRKIQVSNRDLQLFPTLKGGQSFRWQYKNGEWVGIFRDKVWILSQVDDSILFKCFRKNEENKKETVCCNESDVEEEFKSYFRLDVDIRKLYEKWCENDDYFRRAASKLHGVRLLNQDVTENLFTFICSSNNNIKRITLMIECLCRIYGEEIAEIDHETYYSFPKVEKLAFPFVESELREAGFGYRAKFIYKSACEIKKFGGSSWLEKLKDLSYSEAKLELMKLPGIGAKIADCVCLMSLGHMEAVPVDTHILQVASIYLPHLKESTLLTPKTYSVIADHFRSLHGEYAGWANTVLFCSDLKQLKDEEDGGKKKRKHC